MREKIGIIGSGYMAGIIGKKAREKNIETHCFGLDENNYMKDNIDYFHQINIYEIDKIVDIFKKFNIQGVIPTTELTIFPASQVGDILKLNVMPMKVAKNITDKFWVRKVLDKFSCLSIEQPEYFEFDSNLELSKLEKYPYIVKPDSAGGKRGIQVVYTLDELKKAISFAKSNSRNEKVLIEQYIDGGKEYSVESLSYHNQNYIIQITEKESSGAPHCVELAHHQPADINDEIKHKVIHGVSEMLSLVGVENGPCHTEIKIVDNKVYLIEINARPGGDHIAYPLVELSTGYDYILGIIECSLDRLQQINTETFEKNYCGVCFVTKQSSYLKEIYDSCEKYNWFYKKNKVTDELKEIKNNNGFNINYFIYYDKIRKPELPSYTNH